MIGQTLGHYEIVEKLGEGGMGVVYKARDAHLDRFVAIKVLPADKVVDPDRRHVGSPAWSPDGRLLYYVSQHDGSPCVWVQPLDVDGRLAGPASAALHLHSGNGVVGRMTSIGVTNDRLFLLLARTKGDIWSIELER